MTNTLLPNKLSDLLVIALADLKACEEDDNYTIYMRDWHKPNDIGQCEVCMAGAVMAKTLGTAKDVRHEPFQDLFTPNRPKLMAINDVRLGCIGSALSIMGLDENDHLESHEIWREMADYSKDPILFVTQM